MIALAVSILCSQATDADLDLKMTNIAKEALVKFAAQSVKPDQIGLCVLALDAPGKPQMGSYRADVPMYPASVVKLFYMAYAADLLHQKKIKMTPELERSIKDMIVDSSNDATGNVLDVVTGTTGGPELGPKELKVWMQKRQAVNRWLVGLGFKDLNACQKTWNEGPYGREKQGYGPNTELRNMLTPLGCVQMMELIATDKLVSKESCAWMKGYLKREIPAESDKADEQSKGFTGSILPKGFKLWSKAGWTSTVYHDLALVQSPSGKRFILAAFTKGHSNNSELVPFLSRRILEEVGAFQP